MCAELIDLYFNEFNRYKPSEIQSDGYWFTEDEGNRSRRLVVVNQVIKDVEFMNGPTATLEGE